MGSAKVLVVVACLTGFGFGGRGMEAADWPIYRGVNHDGISSETDWKSDWPESGPKVLWRGTVGTGYSSIVISEGRAYTMGNQGDAKDPDKGPETDTVYCLDAVKGEVLWKHSYPCALQPLYYEGGALSTPSVDGGVVYTLSKMGDLFCFDAVNGRSEVAGQCEPGSGLQVADLEFFNVRRWWWATG